MKPLSEKDVRNFLRAVWRNDRTIHKYDGKAGVGKRFATPKEMAQDRAGEWFDNRNLVFENDE